ncbi:conserved hypothetical protein [Alteromonas sp. 38]|uniref:Uncharacterized protein n=3 Tax=Marinomonas TaxID=28253 RepID=F2K4S3_MARM1|nr:MULTISPECIES: hypothetical protein [Gammaproteobacteria]ADZ91466.1 hypothetical protein Marme_2224 [Marinomonas mediterranea MMB-1]AEF55429.1 hypothetical protein Mar181_2394 [Marinomonas posidonica IVIA-Po-181]RBO84070.1 hypothetical protein DFP76_103344 [Marinomonas aquiplantarum]WCN09433.1 hypothetical protein GV055_11070 [Marinomonas mediterranea]WCN13510.1 hypothetical protein GV054_11075 [Marinomonas mediterranea]
MSRSDKKKQMMVYDGQGKELMTIRALEQDGDDLVITGKIFGSMPMKARLKPEEARAALKLLNFKTILFVLTILFRRSKS